jgi:hypothetical protein
MRSVHDDFEQDDAQPERSIDQADAQCRRQVPLQPAGAAPAITAIAAIVP